MHSSGFIIVALATLVVTGAANAKGSKAHPAQVMHPELWLSADHYPPEALRNREEGRVVFVADIDVSGKPTACRVVQSESAESLEQGTCRVVMISGQFRPATDENGRAVASSLAFPVRWVLPIEAPARRSEPGPRLGPADFQAVATYSANDRIQSCDVTVEGAPMPVPKTACEGYGIDPKAFRDRLHLAGPLRFAMSMTIHHGDNAPVLPKAPLDGRMLVSVVARQSVGADGIVSACKVTMDGDAVDPGKTPVPAGLCLKADGVARLERSPFDGRPQHLLFARRIVLLPPAN